MVELTIDFGSLVGGILGAALWQLGMAANRILCPPPPPPPPPSYSDTLRMLLEEQGEGYVEQVLNVALEKVLANNRKYVPYYEKQELEESDSEDDNEPSSEDDNEPSEDEDGETKSGDAGAEDGATDEPPILVDVDAAANADNSAGPAADE